MLRSIRDFFERHIGAEPEARTAHGIELATAALLVEVVRFESAIKPEERDVVLRAITGKFGLSPHEAATLAELAEQEMRQASDYFQFTSLINRHFSAEQKERVVELMWRAAYADGVLSAHEQHVIRKIAELLYVPHGAYIAAKLRARDAAGADGDPPARPPQ
jgi:uncharacterized tellurite resistance protein B-like protein